MSYIDDLIEHGMNFRVRRGEGTVTFTPVSGRDDDIEAFQRTVGELRRSEGEGYSIVNDHRMNDRGEKLIDLVMVRLNP